MFNIAFGQFDSEQIGVIRITCFIACIVRNNLDDRPMFTVETVVIGIRLIRDIDPHAIPNLKGCHQPAITRARI
jgi:hypothetical protein